MEELRLVMAKSKKGPWEGMLAPLSASLTGQLPQGAIVVLGSSLISIAAVTCWLLAQAWWTR